jgi:triacylglycerol lipase
MAQRLVFLVPGFFGFTSIGAVSYFEDVQSVLARALRRRRVDARIVICSTQPTASIPRRAEALRRQVIASGGLRARELHFIGHSTGGLDVRMLLTPGVKISRSGTEERIAGLTKTAISVNTPHHGTPLANHFVTIQGQTLLLVVSALATSGQGRSAILAAAKAVAMVARLDDWIGRSEGPLDRLSAGVLRQMRFDRRDPVWKYLGEIERDQGAVLQLTPEGIELFDAAVSDRAGIDYRCVVSGVPRPHERFRVKEVMDPEHLVLRSLFRLLHALTARPHARYPVPEADAGDAAPARSTAWVQGDSGHQRRHRADFEPAARPGAARRACGSPRRGRALHARRRQLRKLAAVRRGLHSRSLRRHLGGCRRSNREEVTAAGSFCRRLTLSPGAMRRMLIAPRVPVNGPVRNQGPSFIECV